MKERGVRKLDVCFTQTPPVQTGGTVASMPFAPAACGVRMGAYIVERLLGKRDWPRHADKFSLRSQAFYKTRFFNHQSYSVKQIRRTRRIAFAYACGKRKRKTSHANFTQTFAVGSKWPPREKRVCQNKTDSRPRFRLPQPRSGKPQLTVLTAKKVKSRSPQLGMQKQNKDAHQKDHLYKKLTHQDRKIKIFATRHAKTKRKGAHQKDHLYQKDNTPRPQNQNLRTSARKTKQKGAHQKDHLYQKGNTPRPQNKNLRNSACKNKTKTHIKKNI